MAEPFPDRDENIRPGDDLYQHVNGAWERVTEIPSDQASTCLLYTSPSPRD